MRGKEHLCASRRPASSATMKTAAPATRRSIASNKEELVKAAARRKRITADSIERLSVELRRFQVEVKRLQSRERDLVASVKNVTAKLDALHERYLSYERSHHRPNAWCTVSHVDGLEIREDVQGALGIHKWWRK